MNQGTFRIGDAERDAVCKQLSEHYAAGRLTSAEIDDRIKRAVGAKTSTDLQALLEDLPRTPQPLVTGPVVHNPDWTGPLIARAVLDVGIVFITLAAIVCTALLVIVSSTAGHSDVGALTALAAFGGASSVGGIAYLKTRFKKIPRQETPPVQPQNAHWR